MTTGDRLPETSRGIRGKLDLQVAGTAWCYLWRHYERQVERHISVGWDVVRIKCGRWSLQRTGSKMQTIEETYRHIKYFSANVGFGRIWTDFKCITQGVEMIKTLAVAKSESGPNSVEILA